MPDILGDTDTDLLAAEYVLGTLDADERSRAQVLLGIDHGFSGMVKVWERRLGELHVMVEPVEPAPKVWERIKAKLSDTQPGLDFPISPTPAANAAPATVSAPASASAPSLALALELELNAPGGAAAPAPIEAATPEAVEAVEAAIAAMVAPKQAMARPMPTERWPDDVGPVAPSARIWKVTAALMTLVAVLLVGLFAAIRFVPDRVPAQVKQMLLPAQLLAQPKAQARRPPPGATFDE